MKIFMSHSGRQKLFVKELRKHLPDFIDFWIDEKRLVVGDDLDQTIKTTILEDVDFLLLVIDNSAVSSPWVKTEFELGLKREKELGRVFVLPIVLEAEAWEQLDDPSFRSRKYIQCLDFTDETMKATANTLVIELFNWVCQEHFGGSDRRSALELLDEADAFSDELAEKIRLLVYPYREEKPLGLIELLKMLKEQSVLTELSIFDFQPLVSRLQKQGLLAGLVSDSERIWVKQGHHAWKKAIYTKNKEKIAKKAVGFIESGDIIALDSGSTTLQIAKSIANGLRVERWNALTVVTNSIPAARELLAVSTELALGDIGRVLKVLTIEGRVRPSSLAIVNDDEIFSDSVSGFEELLGKLGGANLCFVGTNGLFRDQGFAVHHSFEIKTKRQALENSRRKFIVCDPSKFSIEEKRLFVEFGPDIEVITTKEGSEAVFEEFLAKVENTGTSVVLA